MKLLFTWRTLSFAAVALAVAAPAGATTTFRRTPPHAVQKTISPFGARFAPRGQRVARRPRVPTACTPIPPSALTLPAGDSFDVTPANAAYYDTIPPANTVVDATGCDVGVFLDQSGPTAPVISTISVHDANLYGIFINQVPNVTVEYVNVTNTGNHSGTTYAPNGVQDGVGIDFEGGSGIVTNANVSLYQKNGTAFDYGANVGITNSVITGAGAINYTAQNGIQWYFATVGPSYGNVVTGDHYYNPNDLTYNYGATGILVLCTNLTAGSTALHQFLTRNRATDSDYNVYVDNSATYCGP